MLHQTALYNTTLIFTTLRYITLHHTKLRRTWLGTQSLYTFKFFYLQVSFAILNISKVPYHLKMLQYFVLSKLKNKATLLFLKHHKKTSLLSNLDTTPTLPFFVIL